MIDLTQKEQEFKSSIGRLRFSCYATWEGKRTFSFFAFDDEQWIEAGELGLVPGNGKLSVFVSPRFLRPVPVKLVISEPLSTEENATAKPSMDTI